MVSFIAVVAGDEWLLIVRKYKCCLSKLRDFSLYFRRDIIYTNSNDITFIKSGGGIWPSEARQQP